MLQPCQGHGRGPEHSLGLRLLLQLHVEEQSLDLMGVPAPAAAGPALGRGGGAADADGRGAQLFLSFQSSGGALGRTAQVPKAARLLQHRSPRDVSSAGTLPLPIGDQQLLAGVQDFVLRGGTALLGAVGAGGTQRQAVAGEGRCPLQLLHGDVDGVTEG